MRRGKSINLYQNGKRDKNLSLAVEDEHSAKGPARAKIKKGANGMALLQPGWIIFLSQSQKMTCYYMLYDSIRKTFSE